MRIRIKFTKNESVKYLGHLDIMRAFQRFFNCAEVRMTYSEGFNPHQKMHFALPLGVGITSVAEYLDAEIADGQQPQEILQRLDSVSGSGFDILKVRQLKENAVKAMAAVNYASTEIVFSDPIPEHTEDYLDRESVILTKKTKTGIREVDIRKLIVNMKAEQQKLSILMQSGGENSIKPELIAADLMSFYGLPFHRDRIQICRMELYAQDIIPLIDYQTL